MDPQRILKALSNPHRLDIILWLKHPEQEFGVQVHFKTLIDFPNSVSVKSIQKRCGVSQSSVSTFMTMLERAGLVESRKIDQYTYYRRNDFIYRCASYALNSLDSNTGASFKRSGFSQKDTRSCVLPGLCSLSTPL